MSYSKNVKQDSHGHVYFISDGKAIKIGFSLSVTSRLRELQTSHHAALKVMATLPGTPRTERRFHHLFKKLKIRGEWFRRDPLIMNTIERIKRGDDPWWPPKDRWHTPREIEIHMQGLLRAAERGML